jgi:hypothetical protein
VISKLKQVYVDWKERRFLKRHGCENRKQYERRYDPDIHYRATEIKQFYHGYPYIHCFENRAHQIYWWDLGLDGSKEIVEWAEANLEGKFRFDGHRCIKNYWGEWEINEIGGGDYYFVAFKSDLDMFNFKLRWA